MSRVIHGAPPKPPAVRRLAKAVLGHPLALKLRRPLRDAWWWFRGRGTTNPPVPDDVRSVLFVCLGNICRSPFGAELATRMLADAGRGDIRCASAGIRPSQDNRAPELACQASAAYGVSLSAHRPQLLTRELIESHDLVIVVEWRQFAQLRAQYPKHRDRVFLLPLFDDAARNAYERYNIADPFGRPLEAFEECYRRMERAVRALVSSTSAC